MTTEFYARVTGTNNETQRQKPKLTTGNTKKNKLQQYITYRMV